MLEKVGRPSFVWNILGNQKTWGKYCRVAKIRPCYYILCQLTFILQIYYKNLMPNVIGMLLTDKFYCFWLYSLVPFSRQFSNPSSKRIKPGKMPSRQSFSSARSSMQKKAWSRLNNDYQIRHSRDWRKKTLKLSLPNIHLVSTLRFIKQSWVGSLSCWL